MATDWQVARDLDEVAETVRLPVRVREAARAGARLIRDLDEELDVRNQMVTRLRDGQPAGMAELPEMRETYLGRLQAALDRRG